MYASVHLILSRHPCPDILTPRYAWSKLHLARGIVFSGSFSYHHDIPCFGSTASKTFRLDDGELPRRKLAPWSDANLTGMLLRRFPLDKPITMNLAELSDCCIDLSLWTIPTLFPCAACSAPFRSYKHWRSWKLYSLTWETLPSSVNPHQSMKLKSYADELPYIGATHTFSNTPGVKLLETAWLSVKKKGMLCGSWHCWWSCDTLVWISLWLYYEWKIDDLSVVCVCVHYLTTVPFRIYGSRKWPGTNWTKIRYRPSRGWPGYLICTANK